MRRCLALLPLFLVGCGDRERATTSRVVLPAGLKPPTGLKPDPPLPTRRAAPPKPGEPSIAGACRYGEERLACWDAGGTPSEGLTKSVRGLLIAGRTPLPATLGGRNRLVVIDLPRGGMDTTFEVNVQLENGAQSISGTSGSQRFPLVLEGNAKPKTVRVVQRRRLPETVEIALRRGAIARAEGGVVTVEAVERVESEDPMSFHLRGKPGWRVVFRKVGGADVAFAPIDPYPDATGDGRRARFDGKTGKLVVAPPNAARITTVMSGKPDGTFEAIIDVDPVKAKTIALSVSRERATILTDIPMDPR